jgi:putative hemolysin
MQLINTNDLVKVAKLDNFGGENTAKILMSLFQFDKINQIYTRHYYKESHIFIDAVLKDAGINYHIDEDELRRIPGEGAFILIANHPFGGIEGLIVLDSILKIRPDLKIMANFLFNWISPLKEHVLGVNPFETHKQAYNSFHGLKTSLMHLHQGHPLVIFPAGEVSTHNHSGVIEDRQWNQSIIRFIKNAGVPVIPAYFHGQNSWLFHFMGKIHPLLRTVKIPSEILNKRNEIILVRIGNPVSVKDQDQFTDVPQLGRYLRAKTYALETAVEINEFFKPKKKNPKVEEIASPVPVDFLAREIIAITPQYQLFQWQHYTVYCAPSAIIPHMTREIGRLREMTFREIGEGTNRSMDLDEFDLYYHQLFIWDSRQQKIAGGYRLGKGKDIFTNYGVKGFYTHTLFRMTREMYPVLAQSIELGRSFVTREYQRKPLSLFMLWKGILSFLQKNTDYKYLIGPVSISNNYTKLTQQMIVEYVKKNHFHHDMSRYVQPRNPFILKPTKVDMTALTEKVNDLNTLDHLIKDFEVSGIKMPVLLKKYLGLGGKIIGFNMDPNFNNCLDGLLLLELEKVSEEIIQTLGKEMQVNYQS